MVLPRSWLCIGPSTLSMNEDVRDPAPVAAGTGFIARAAADLNMAFQYATRAGAHFSVVSTNPDTVSLFPYVDGAVLWIGNNELYDNDDTVDQTIGYLTAVYNALTAAGVRWFIVFPTVPRTGSTDDWATEENQSFPIPEAGFNGISVHLSRAIAEFARARDNVIFLPLSGLRAPQNYLKWRGSTPQLTPDGLHFTAEGSIIAAADVVDAIDTYIRNDWPTHQANMALACEA